MFKAEYIFARILLPFILGIGIFYFFPTQHSLSITKIGTALLLTFILLINITYTKLNFYRFKGITGLLFFTFFFTFGSLLCLLNNEKLNSNYYGAKHYPCLRIWVNDEPQQSNDILRFKAKVTAGYENSKYNKLSGQLLLALKLDTLNPVKLKYGDELLIISKYLEVEPPYNPAEFDFKAWLASQNIYDQAFINQNHLIRTGKNIGNPLLKFALDLREKQVQKYRSLIKNEEAFAVASTLILGYRADLSKETLAAYSKTGTIHALSVSGAHVAIIYVVLDFLLLFLNRKRGLKIVKLMLICSLIWAYALITGLSPSVVRSAIMITVFIIAKTYSKNKNGYNILAFTCFCQLTYNPFLIWDVGFQLSYLAVFGLIYLQPKIYNLWHAKNKWIDKLWNFIALSIAAQLVTFPLSIYYFHQFPLYFLFGNLFISIPLILMMYLGIAILIPGLSFLAPIFEWIINHTNQALRWISDLPFSTFSSIWINLPEFISLSFALAFLIYGLDKLNKRFIFISLSIFITYQILILFDDFNALNQRKIIFFTLRKNYACAYITGRHAVLLTDLTSTDKNYQFFVKPALDQSQIDQVDFINFKKDTIINDFILKDKQIIFHHYKTLVIDESMNYKNLNIKGQFSSIWIHGNTKFNLEKITKEIKFKTIIIDASNKDYKITAHKAFAQKIKIHTYVLKKNKAYLVQLTQ
jgi:competence protein ComEC